MNGDGVVRFGLAQRCITPPHEVDLYRFGEVPRTSRQVRDDLWARTLVLEDATGERTAIISLDLIWLSRELGVAVREMARRELGLRPECILLAATHTHCSPQVRPATFGGGRRDHEYENFLLAQVCACLTEAVGSLRPGRLRFGVCRSAVAVYRRKRIVDIEALKRLRFRLCTANRPVPGVRHEDTLSVLWLYGDDEKPAGMLCNLACHASLLRENALSADYPGVVASRMAEKFGSDFVTLFLQGFSGDLRPNLVRLAPFSFSRPLRSAYHILFDRLLFVRDVGDEELHAFAGRVFEEILATQVHPCGVLRISASCRNLTLPLEPPPGQEYFLALSRSGKQEERDYAKHVAGNYDRPAAVPFIIQKIVLSPGMVLIALEGEIFMEYALWLREIARRSGKNILPVGCANGMAGYVPDANALELGGYETDRTLVLYGLPARFSSEVEGILKRALGDLLEQGEGETK